MLKKLAMLSGPNVPTGVLLVPHYRRYYEVHTIPCRERKLPKPPWRVRRAYLVPIPDREALNYLNENKISLDQMPIRA